MAVDEKRRTLERIKKEGLTGSIDSLLPFLSDVDGKIRRLAVQLLARSGQPAAAPALMLTLIDRDPTVRAAAAWGMTALGPEALTLAVGQWRHWEREDRMKVTRAFGRFVFGAEPILTVALKDEDSWIRAEAARLLGNSSSPLATEPLLEATNDRAPAVRLAALRGLKGRQHPGVRAAALLMMNDPDLDVAAVASAVARTAQTPLEP